MDNNFNQQAPQQPVYQQAPQQMSQQPVYQQAPQQQVYQQMPQQQAAPKQPLKFNLMELISVGCAGLSFIFAILGTTLTCTCSASKAYDGGEIRYIEYIDHGLSAVFILSIFAILFAAGGIACAILALKKKDAEVKAGKLAYIAIAVSAFAFIYAFIPMITMCGYSCSLDSAHESYMKKLY